MRTHIASWLQRLANPSGVRPAVIAEPGQFAKQKIGETGVESSGETAEPGRLAKQKIGETKNETGGGTEQIPMPHRSKEAERSARRRAANPEKHRRQHRIYSAKSKRKAKLKKAEVAFRAAAAEHERVETLIAKLLEEMAKDDGRDRRANGRQ